MGAQAGGRTAVMMLPDNYKIFLVADPVDMRRSFDGLSAVIVERLGCHPVAGSLFLFRGRGGDRLKILVSVLPNTPDACLFFTAC